MRKTFDSVTADADPQLILIFLHHLEPVSLYIQEALSSTDGPGYLYLIDALPGCFW